MGIVLHNGRVENDIEIPMDNKVYEVLRVINKTPLFLKEHFNRLENSLNIKGAENKITFEKFKEYVDDLIILLNKENFNIKVVLDTLTNNDYFFENPSSYPSVELYEKGIETVSLKYERPNPNAKIVNSSLTEQAKEITKQEDVYEVILVDSNDNITEGSKSNIFFTKDGILYTPPIDKVLPGITRQEIIKSAKELNLTVREIIVPLVDINKYSGAFISGTSPKILPINRINDVLFDVKDETIVQLIRAFNNHIENDLKNYSSSI